MTTNPYKHHAELSCPCCHVKGKVITNSADGVEFDQGCFTDEPYVCCECGASWLDAGTFCDDALKEYRVNLMRLIEGRPYEPPKVDLGAYDSVLKDYYRAEDDAFAKSRAAFDEFTAKFKVLLTSNVSAERRGQLLASTWAMPRSKTLPTGDVVTDMGGSATIQFKDSSDPPWTSFLYDSDSGARVICIGYRTKQYHWNLATDEVTEK